jgi:glycosyltransferase involved in cell wall biosynthesis
MRPIYARAKALLALSLWWESFGRVAAEAAMNGIPVLHTNRGGLPEAAAASGIKIDFAKYLHQPPYNRIPESLDLVNIKTELEKVFDTPPKVKKNQPKNPTDVTRMLSKLQLII